jgi:hypothetical protein
MPLDSTKSCHPYTERSFGNEARQTFEGHRRQLRQSIGLEVLQESDHEDDRASRSEQPLPDGSPEREDSVSLLSLPSSYLHLSRVLGHHYLALAMTVRPPSHESVTLSAPRENHQFVQPCGQVHVYNRYLLPCTRKTKHDEVNTPLSSMTWRTESERASELFAEFVQNECQTYFPCSLCLLEILLTACSVGMT